LVSLLSNTTPIRRNGYSTVILNTRILRLGNVNVWQTSQSHYLVIALLTLK